MKSCARAFVLWLPLALATSGVFVFSYWAVQQSYRQSLNDPQIQMAEDGARTLDAGASPASLVPRGAPSIDITASLAPWLAVFDASGAPLESSGTFGSEPLRLPAGVFDPRTWKAQYAQWGIALSLPARETRFSWQPSPEARQAVVLVQTENGSFVAAGRSMRETENRVRTLTAGFALAWGGTELASLVLLVLLLSLGWL